MTAFTLHLIGLHGLHSSAGLCMRVAACGLHKLVRERMPVCRVWMKTGQRRSWGHSNSMRAVLQLTAVVAVCCVCGGGVLVGWHAPCMCLHGLLFCWHVHEEQVVRLPTQAGARAHAGLQSVDEDRSV
jgi:hypothetical protein